MRLHLRSVVGIALCVVGVAMLGWSASAALGADPTFRDVPASQAASPSPEAPLADAPLAAKVHYEALGTGRTDGVDLPAVASSLHAPLRSADTGALPLGVRVRANLDPVAREEGASSSSAQGARIMEQHAFVIPASSLVAGAAAFTLAGLVAYFWGGVKALGTRVLVLPAIGLYARISRAEVFENGIRERIFATIKARPGIAASDLGRLVGVSWGTTIYHLDVLEQNGMVTSLRNGRHRRYFENGAQLTATKEAVAILQNPVTATVATSIQAGPGASQKELAGRVGLSPQALHWHLQRLVRAGLVRKEREGRVVKHFAASQN